MILLPYFWAALPAMVLSPVLPARSSERDLRCTYCTMAGHLAKDCPQRAKEREYKKESV